MPIRITDNKLYFNDGSWMNSANIDTSNLIPSGTRMFFFQTNAPTGWTKLTNFDDIPLRLVNGSVGSSQSYNYFSTVFSSKVPSGTISVSVNNHSNISTGSTTPSALSLNNSDVTGLSFGPVTINDNTSGSLTITFATNSFHFGESTSSTTISGTVNIENDTQDNPSHNHTYDLPSLSTTSASIYYEMGVENIQEVYTDIILYTDSDYTSTVSDTYGSQHTHGVGTVSFSGHYHGLNTQHGQETANVSLPAHNHTNSSITGSFTSSGSHTHTLSYGNHYHSFSLSHSASGSFTGNSMDFNINYIDVILAQKD